MIIFDMWRHYSNLIIVDILDKNKNSIGQFINIIHNNKFDVIIPYNLTHSYIINSEDICEIVNRIIIGNKHTIYGVDIKCKNAVELGHIQVTYDKYDKLIFTDDDGIEYVFKRSAIIL